MNYPQIALETDSTTANARKARHAVSSGLSFVQTAVNTISKSQTDLPQALRMISLGTQKLRDALLELDQIVGKESYAHLAYKNGEPDSE